MALKYYAKEIKKLKVPLFWDISASIIKTMTTEAKNTSKTSVNFYRTIRRKTQKTSHPRTCRYEILISYISYFVSENLELDSALKLKDRF
jgi:hypothetical protein